MGEDVAEDVVRVHGATKTVQARRCSFGNRSRVAEIYIVE